MGMEGFGIYFVYIFSLILISFGFDKGKVLDKLIHRYGLMSQEHLFPYICKINQVDKAKSEKANEDHAQNYSGECCDIMAGGRVRVSSEIGEYKVEFLRHLVRNPVYYATAAFDAPYTDGYLFVSNCLGIKIRFSPGFFRDFLLYTFNKHALLSMFTATKGHPFSRAKRRSAFVCQTCIALGFGVYVDIAGLDSLSRLLFNIFVVSPVVICLNYLLFYLLVCPCLVKYRGKGGLFRYCMCAIEALGWTVLLPILCMCFVYLLVAALVNPEDLGQSLGRIASFAYSVQVLSAIQEIILYFIHFLNGRQSVVVNCCCLNIITFGKYFQEKIEVAELKEDVDYVKKTSSIPCCGLTYTRFISKDKEHNDSMKESKMKKAYALVTTNEDESRDIEMIGGDGYVTGPYSNSSRSTSSHSPSRSNPAPPASPPSNPPSSKKKKSQKKYEKVESNHDVLDLSDIYKHSIDDL